jgi:hypothetical protein
MDTEMRVTIAKTGFDALVSAIALLNDEGPENADQLEPLIAALCQYASSAALLAAGNQQSARTAPVAPKPSK